MVVGQLATEKDVLVIGGGPGGYTAAIRAAQLGKEVTLIEADSIGGICLNKGCIPSKVFSEAAGKIKDLTSLKNYGIEISEHTFQYSELLKKKDQTVTQLRKGVEALCKAHKIELVKGKATFLSESRIGVEIGDAYEIFSFKSAIIATGVSSKGCQQVEVDQEYIIDDYGLYNLKNPPEHIVIVGTCSGYIALEAATSFKALGSEVTIVFENDQNDFGFDSAIEKELKRQLKKAKIKFLKDLQLHTVKIQNGRVMSVFTSNSGDENVLESSHLYIPSNYLPNTNDLGLDRAGVSVDSQGWISIDSTCGTSVPNIFAVGDVTGGEQLAVKAIKQGKVAAESISGKKTEWDHNYIPKVAYSLPPVASIGFTEEEATQNGYTIETGMFPLTGNGYASVKEKRDGFIKVISEKETERILGIHILGEGAMELISTGITALEMVARTEDLSYPYYPHPSINEGILEAIEDITGRAIHKPPVKS